MGIYLGIIDRKGYEPGDFYNYRPLYELRSGSWIQMTADEKADLLPDSSKRDINFSYNWNASDQTAFMQSHFPEKTLIVFEFVREDLLDNISTRGERNQTGYKVIAEEMMKKGKIRTLDEEGFFPLVQKDEIISNFQTDNIVEIESIGLPAESKIFVDLGNFYAGPYSISHREMYRGINESYYIRPQIKENKYSIQGYQKENCLCQEIIFGNVRVSMMSERS